MPEVNGQKFPYTEEGMKAAKEAEMEVLETPGDDRLMKLAEEADMAEEEAMPLLDGDFTLNKVNGVVDGLNRVNRLFQAPPYPSFETVPDRFPPEFIKNLQMVDAAVISSGMEEYKFDLEDIKDDQDLVQLRGKLDAMASDKSFKAFLTKPIGTGEIQQEAGMGNKPTDLGRGPVSPSPSAEGGDAEVDLFMARMA